MTEELVEVTLTQRPDCQICKNMHNPPPPAEYDFRTRDGSWAYGCEPCYISYRLYPELGMGKGQRILVNGPTQT